MLFHGPLMQGIESVEGCGERGIAGWVSTAPVICRVDRPAGAEQVADRPAGDRFRVSARRALDPGDRWVPTHSRPAWEACASSGANFLSKVRGSSSRSSIPSAIARHGGNRDPRRRSPARRPARRLRVRRRRFAQPGVSAQPALVPLLRRLELSDAGRFTRGTRRSDRHCGHRRALSRQRRPSRNSGITSAMALIRRSTCPRALADRPRGSL